MTKSQLIEKVYRCIDETYPDTTTQDLEEFNIPAFLEEAIRWVAKSVPTTALGEGADGKDKGLALGGDFLRLIKFKMEGWNTSVTEALSEDNPKYWQQQNPALRGGNSRPVVFLVDGGTKLEPYPYYEKNVKNEGENGANNVKTPDIVTFKYFAMPTADADYAKFPNKLLDITAWKTAELVFSMMQDANGVAVAQAQITSILPTL